MIDPSLLCNKHLIGEHGEIHKHRHNFVKQYSISGRISPVVQIEPSSMASRHDELAEEMLNRGLNHLSPYDMPDISYLPKEQLMAVVNTETSIAELINRCEKCKEKIQCANLFLG